MGRLVKEHVTLRSFVVGMCVLCLSACQSPAERRAEDYKRTLEDTDETTRACNVEATRPYGHLNEKMVLDFEAYEPDLLTLAALPTNADLQDIFSLRNDLQECLTFQLDSVATIDAELVRILSDGYVALDELYVRFDFERFSFGEFNRRAIAIATNANRRVAERWTAIAQDLKATREAELANREAARLAAFADSRPW